MLALLAALALPRAPYAAPALTEPTAHELERAQCKDSISNTMTVDEAYTACTGSTNSKSKQCTFCAKQVTEGSKLKKGDKKLTATHGAGPEDWVYRCSSHPRKWHGFYSPKCKKSDGWISSADEVQRGPYSFNALRVKHPCICLKLMNMDECDDDDDYSFSYNELWQCMTKEQKEQEQKNQRAMAAHSNKMKETNDPVRMQDQRQQKKEPHMRLLKELQEHIDAGRGDETFYLGGR